MPSLLDRLIGLADEPTDDDDLRLRKRVGVIAGYILVLAPLQLPILAQGLPLSWVVAATMPLVSASNLLLLARTRRFDRYVVLVIMVVIFPAVIEIALGGLGGSSAAIVFAFLGPVFALLALGPRRATAWFVAFLVVVAGVILLDPLVSSRIAPQPYPLRLIWYGANLVVPLGFTFAMLRYTDLRRRRAEARSDELLTNAIPASIATRLKRGEEHIAESYPETTVLFADLAGFTPWAERPIRRGWSASWTSCSRDSTSSPRNAGSRRSRRSATPTWPSRARPEPHPITPLPLFRWRAAC